MSIEDAVGLDLHFAEYQDLKARIDLYDETILVTYYDQGLPARVIEAAPASLATAFSGVPVSTGLLPRNCLFYDATAGQARIAIYVPAAVRTVTLTAPDGEPEALTLPTPPLVFVGGPGAAYHLYAVKQYPHGQERLFHAPFPNVSAADHQLGVICHGDATFPVCSAETIGPALETFFSSRFNDHWTDGKSQAHPEDVLEAWRYLHREQVSEYPLEDLVRTRRTLADLIGESP